MLFLSRTGELMLFDNSGEFQMVLPHSPFEQRSATCILAFSKGFVIGGDDGLIRVFERYDDPKELYRKTKTIPLESSGSVGVRNLALSPAEEVLAVTTSTAQLFQLSLLSSDLLKADESPAFEPVLTPFHTGAILGMDVCIRNVLTFTVCVCVLFATTVQDRQFKNIRRYSASYIYGLCAHTGSLWWLPVALTSRSGCGTTWRKRVSSASFSTRRPTVLLSIHQAPVVWPFI